MKKTFRFLASLTLGFMVASCQNGLEEVINESEVQDELATTRAEDDSSDDMPLRYEVGPDIVGDYIICGTDTARFDVERPSGTTTTWEYSSSLFHKVFKDNSTLCLSLNNNNSIADATITAYFINSNQSINSVSRFYLGVNGPHYQHCSLRIIRNSDQIEVYPSSIGLSPYTSYTAYFSCSTASNLSLTWETQYLVNPVPSGYSMTFSTGANPYGFVTVKGTMPGSSLEKELLGVTIY